ncbi:MAG: glycosyltransferase family 2 protein [Alphaproteobacteria bacterium]
MAERAPLRSPGAAAVDATPEVAIAIVTCDRRALLADCLASVDGLDYPADRVEVLVFDNGSTDGTREWLRSERPRVRLLESPTNLGFAVPNDRCAEASSARLLCLVNNDVRLHPAFLRELVDARSSSGAACVGARILDADGARIEFDGGVMSFDGHAAPRGWGDPAPEPGAEAPGTAVPTLFASGGAMLVDRDVFLDAGGFDEDYFAYFEDVDFGWRAWVLGHRVAVAPRAVAWHREHGSEGLLPAGRRMELLERNALLSVWKNYEPGRAERAWACAVALAAERARIEPARAAACERGILGAAALLPRIEPRRQAIQARRLRCDAEIAPLFREPMRPPIGGAEYAARQAEVAALFGIAELFGPSDREGK